MSGVPFVSVRQLLGGSLTPLGRLMAAGRRLNAANTALDEFLDEPLKGRVSVARAGPETLTLTAGEATLLTALPAGETISLLIDQVVP